MKHIIFIFLLFCTACTVHESTTPLYIANVKNGINYKYEIELRFHREVQGGNMHMLFLDLAKHKYDSSYWLYTNTLEGEIEPSQFAVCVFQEFNGNSCGQKNIKGKISFKEGSLTLDIQEPHYNENEIPYEWVPSIFNGEWRIIK